MLRIAWLAPFVVRIAGRSRRRRQRLLLLLQTLDLRIERGNGVGEPLGVVRFAIDEALLEDARQLLTLVGLDEKDGEGEDEHCG